MKDLTRWGRDYLQVGNAMEIFRRNNVRFIAVNNGIDSEKPDTLLDMQLSKSIHTTPKINMFEPSVPCCYNLFHSLWLIASIKMLQRNM